MKTYIPIARPLVFQKPKPYFRSYTLPPSTACTRLALRAAFQGLRVRFIAFRGASAVVAIGKRVMLPFGG